MKVLMIVTWYSPRDCEVMDAGSFHYEQSMALKKYCDTALLFPIDSSEHKGIAKAEERGLLTYRLAQKAKFLPLRFLEMLRDAKEVIRDYKPDVIHAHVAEMAGVVACILGKKFNIPVVITEHNPIELSHFERLIKRLQVGYAYKRSKANICVSSDSKNKLSAIFPKCEFEVIYNGTSNPKEIVLEDRDYMKKDCINCLIVGAFYDKYIKGYQFLLPAIKELRDKGVKIILHICGDGDYFSYYRDIAKELNIEEVCVFHGLCDRKKVYTLMSQVDFCISASIFECSGVSVQEAMLLGNPLVVTKSGGANSLVTDKTAIIVDRESIEALSVGIEEMINRLSEFNREDIREYAYENFEMDGVSKRYVDIYKSLSGTGFKR